MKIETGRLMLREMTDDDFDALYAVLSDRTSCSIILYVGENRVRTWIGRNMERYRVFGFGLGVVLKKTGEMIGDCGLPCRSSTGSTAGNRIPYPKRPAAQRIRREAAKAVRTGFTARPSTSFTLNEAHECSVIKPPWRGCRLVDEYHGR